MERRFACSGAELLSTEGYLTMKAVDCDSALELFQKADRRVDLIFSDAALLGTRGSDLLSELRRETATVPIAVMSAKAEYSNDAFDVLPKPCHWSELNATVAGAIACSRIGM
jgi:DNA-binding response OmpR family regulator